MEPDAGKRDRGDSFAATNGRPAANGEGERMKTTQGRPNSEDKNGGETMATSQVDESRSQDIGISQPNEPRPQGLDIMTEPQDEAYGIQSEKSQTMSTDLPRDDQLYPSSTHGNEEMTVRPNATLEPPVTKGTLTELDVNKIVHNPKLRHDINFDPDLHFRPNLDGERGRKKTQKSKHFWDTMRAQLREYLTNRDQFEAQIGGAEWTLSVTLNAIRGILETLVPQRDRSSVQETFNVELLMQQFRKGVADLVKLANWLSQLLKCHCAPMRDDWVDEMVSQLSDGDRNHDVDMLVAGLQNLLGVLEAMKLDVANHQIRCLRPLLIEDTVHFEQKYFMKRIAMQKMEVSRAHAWYKSASTLVDIVPLDPSLSSQGNTWDFMKALVNLALPHTPTEDHPQTFTHDEDRLAKLKADLLDLTNLEICMHMYRGLEAQNRQEARYTREDTPTMSFTSSPIHRPASPADNTLLSLPTIPLPHHFSSRHERGHFIREFSGRQVWIPSVDEEIATSNISSPRLSPSSTASTPAAGAPTPFYLSLPTSDATAQVRTSLQAILASNTAPDRWTSLCPSMALEILRLTNTPLTRLPHFESHLAFHTSRYNSRLYQEAETRVLSQLFPELQKLTATYSPLTSLQIFELTVGTKNTPAGVTPLNRAREEIIELATRIAHIGILHWRVWAPLAYLVNPDADEEVSPGIERAESLP